ncbi:hypothetical protein HNP55_003920 [Paucibacter oligotrophus]|uniref:Uncharacterized protein n=1 Tax=Roseateles oligotrophus TaxID=1769250 RepID=A0A840LB21_9BURK|nr:hypothetical protein [Roseateles oligotrophus]
MAGTIKPCATLTDAAPGASAHIVLGLCAAGQVNLI